MQDKGFFFPCVSVTKALLCLERGGSIYANTRGGEWNSDVQLLQRLPLCQWNSPLVRKTHNSLSECIHFAYVESVHDVVLLLPTSRPLIGCTLVEKRLLVSARCSVILPSFDKTHIQTVVVYQLNSTHSDILFLLTGSRFGLVMFSNLKL